MGGMKTAGGVDLFTDFTVSPKDWQIRKDSVRRRSVQGDRLGTQQGNNRIDFFGKCRKSQTADRLLERQPHPVRPIEGDFRIVIDTAAPLKSSFTGNCLAKDCICKASFAIPSS
jgi:hypothetical protein